MHSQADTGADPAEGAAGWVRHASGSLAVAGPLDRDLDVGWPPADAESVPVEGFYDLAAAAGYGYGPAFRGLRAAWRRGGEVFVEVSLPEGHEADVGRFGVHPALLDAVLQAAGLGVLGRDGAGGGVRLPFAWSGVRVAGDGPAVLRARVSPAGADGVAVVAAGPDGRVAVVVERLVLRPVPAGALAVRGAYHPSLFAVDWVQVPPPVAVPGRRWTVLGEDSWQVGAGLAGAGVVEWCAGLAELAAAVDAGAKVPGVVMACLPVSDGDGGDVAAAVGRLGAGPGAGVGGRGAVRLVGAGGGDPGCGPGRC